MIVPLLSQILFMPQQQRVPFWSNLILLCFPSIYLYDFSLAVESCAVSALLIDLVEKKQTLDLGPSFHLSFDSSVKDFVRGIWMWLVYCEIVFQLPDYDFYVLEQQGCKKGL